MLTIGETADGPFFEAPWVGPLIDLGLRAFRFCSGEAHLSSSDQLVIAITVPTRDLAASLVALGWLMAAPLPPASDPIEQLKSTPPGTLIRMVTNRYVILNRLIGFDGSRVHVDTKFESRVVAAVTRVPDCHTGPCRADLPPVPALGPWTATPGSWARYVCQPPSGLAIIGARSRTLDDLTTWVSSTNQVGQPTQLRDIVLPQEGHVPTWATKLVSPTTLPEDLDDPPEYKAVILDGAPAIRAITQVDTRLAVAVVDRSVMDESAEEQVVQRRNNRGRSVNLLVELGWQPPRGVEAIAFRTRR